MNLIQIKQIENLSQAFSNIGGDLDGTGQYISEITSGDISFFGEKTFGNNVFFQENLQIDGFLSGINGNFRFLGIGLAGGQEPLHGLHLSGAKDLFIDQGNAYITGSLYITGQNNEPQQIIPEFIRKGGTLYQTGLNKLLVGYDSESVPPESSTFSVSGDSRVLGSFYVSEDSDFGSNVAISNGLTANGITGNSIKNYGDAYIDRLYVTGDGGGFVRITGVDDEINLVKSQGTEGSLQFKTGQHSFSGTDGVRINPQDDSLYVSGLISGASDGKIDGSLSVGGYVSGVGFRDVGAGTKYFSGNANVEILSDNNVFISGNNKSEIVNLVPTYNYERITSSPHSYDLNNSIEGYATNSVTFSVEIPQPAPIDEGRRIVIKDVDGNADVRHIEVEANVGTSINGTTGLMMTGSYQSIELFSDGAGWYSIGPTGYVN